MCWRILHLVARFDVRSVRAGRRQAPGHFSAFDFLGLSRPMTISAQLSTLVANTGELPVIHIRLADSRAKADQSRILVHNITEYGFIFESDSAIPVGQRLEFKLPHGSAARGKVAWTSGKLVGCNFDIPVSRASLDDRRLRDAVTTGNGSTDSAQYVESFGLRLRRLRLAMTMSQGQLATRMSVSIPAVCGWEADRHRPKPRRMEELAKILGMSLSDLLGHQEATNLQRQIAEARQAIAKAAGVSEDRVKIDIELQA